MIVFERKRIKTYVQKRIITFERELLSEWTASEMDGENKIIQPLISLGSVAEWTSRGQPSSCVWDFF